MAAPRMPSMPGKAQHVFSQVPRVDIPRSVFDRSYGHKTTMTSGYLQPFYVDEALPGDTFTCRANIFVRQTTLLKPIMDNQYIDTFFFAVPLRLVWANFVKMMGERNSPGDSISYTVPQVIAGAGGFTTASLYDFMGIPLGVGNLSINALPFRAYNLIYNQWFRDENLINAANAVTSDGPDDPSWYTVRKRAKRHDYFTSCLPWPQKGTAVSLPLGTTAPVVSSGDGYPTFNMANPQGNYATPGSLNTTASMRWWDPAGTGEVQPTNTQRASWANPKLAADLSTATAATINELRQAFQIQRLLERDARGGSRYIEIVRSHFGVISPDARLQRSEYLGGGSVPMVMSPVAQTSSTDATTPQANLAGVGTAHVRGHGFTKSFVEHSLIIGLMNVRTDVHYYQGLERMWSRSTRYDFYWPVLSHIGEQAVYNREIYCKNDGNDALVFGYQERYGEYRYKPSQVTGLMRPVVTAGATSVALWHLCQDFTALPTLSQTFIEDTPPMSRVKAVTSEVDFIVDAFVQLRCARPMPVYGVPGLIDHF